MLRVQCRRLGRRYYSKITMKSSEIRKLFLEYFIKSHEHKFVRSSPVIPLCDPTVAFVNAGMNQFKTIFLGKRSAPFKRVTNYQKCVRVGGKHNDLYAVGRDGYHHTFFEMLGNWSFGDYFKKDACEMALDLLIGPLAIPKSRLYVTYFGGDEKLNLPADEECFHTWRNLGFPKERIIPFGAADNFWEMGLSGPCGPCTEIHISHSSNINPAEGIQYVNTGRADLTELWNIVFIQYNRNIDGSITLLPEKHVDTGMGFERLTAILQNKSSNYDTDLFTPIFDAIHKICRVPEYKGLFSSPTGEHELDTAYRILADHVRMITACLSDGMLPDQNQKLRRILRTSLLLAENKFKNEHLLKDIIPVVADILGPAYPEMLHKMNDAQEIIAHEQEIFKALRTNCAKDFAEIVTLNPNLDDVDLMESPGFIPAFKELQRLKDSFKNSTIPGQFLFKLHDTYGLNDEVIEKIAKIENLNLDTEGMLTEFVKAKQKYKLSLNVANEIEQKINDAIAKYALTAAKTEDHYKYDYLYDSSLKKYIVPPLATKIVGILQNGVEKNDTEISSKDLVCIITEKTNHYYESGGQQSDRGKIVKTIGEDEIIFEIVNVTCLNNCVIHSGKFVCSKPGMKFSVGDEVQLQVDNLHRTLNTLHHTSTHLLNAAVRRIFRKVTYQTSSAVTSENLKLELGVIGYVLTKDDLVSIENLVRKVIDRNLQMKVRITTAAEILNDPEITMVPGEIYPEEGLRLLTLQDPSLDFKSKELCCGTHVNSTSEIKSFCITNFKQTSRARYAFTAVAGELATKALEDEENIKSVVEKLERHIKTENTYDSVETELHNIKKRILHSDIVLPYVFRVNCLEKINELSRTTTETSRAILKNLVEIEMKNLLQEKPIDQHPFIIHFLKTSSFVKSVSLQKATKLCADRPVLVISCCEGILKARCCVPSDKINNTFSAQKWLQEFTAIFKGEVTPPKGQNPNEVCNMKAKKVFTSIFDEQLEAAINKANQFASQHL